jgi:hypothetical protein
MDPAESYLPCMHDSREGFRGTGCAILCGDDVLWVTKGLNNMEIAIPSNEMGQ